MDPVKKKRGRNIKIVNKGRTSVLMVGEAGGRLLALRQVLSVLDLLFAWSKRGAAAVETTA